MWLFIIVLVAVVNFTREYVWHKYDLKHDTWYGMTREQARRLGRWWN